MGIKEETVFFREVWVLLNFYGWINPNFFTVGCFSGLTRGLYSYMYGIYTSLHTFHKIGSHNLDLNQCLLGNSPLSTMVSTFLFPSKGGHYEEVWLLYNLLILFFSMGIWVLVSNHYQLCISSWSFCCPIHEPIILQDSSVVYGVACCWCTEWEWILPSYSTRKCFLDISWKLRFSDSQLAKHAIYLKELRHG